VCCPQQAAAEVPPLAAWRREKRRRRAAPKARAAAPAPAPPWAALPLAPLLLLAAALLLGAWAWGGPAAAPPAAALAGAGAPLLPPLPLCSALRQLPPGAQWAQGGTAHPFAPTGCAYRAWGLEAARGCLRGRHLYVVGNSVARDFFFQALSGLCQLPRDRGAEMGCKRSATGCAVGCAAFNISGTFAFSNSLGPPLPGYLYHDADACPQPVEDCTRSLLAASREGDALVFLHGLSLAWEAKHMTAGVGAPPQQQPLGPAGLGPQLLPSERLAFEGLVAQAGAAWRGTVQRAWRGSPGHVFRLRLAPWSLGNTSFDHGQDRAFLGAAAGLLGAVNEGLDAAFAGAGWGTVDQWGVNGALHEDAGGNRAHYADFVHYEGEPHDAALNIVLTGLCGAPSAG
jgi:hypothetical protein